MGHVRAFAREDIPQVAHLHRTVFGTPGSAPPRTDVYHRYFLDVFLENPWREEGLSSRVYQEDDGCISGFLGVMPRRMSMDGRPLLAAICSQFAVHPNKRGLVGLQLLKAVFEGPQDLSITDEANDATRRIWEARGGTTALLYSMRWLRPLRPVRLAASWLQQHTRSAQLAPIWRALGAAGDAAAPTLLGRCVHQPDPRLKEERLDRATLVAHLPAFAGRSLRPEYDDRSLNWLLERADQLRSDGCFEAVAVRNDTQELLGWYLWYFKAGGIGDVLQLVAGRHTVKAVVNHLIDRAWRRGVIALSGRLEPAFADDLLAGCLLSRGNAPWMLVHSKRSSVLHAIQRGDTCLSRLDGEWCLRFQP